MSDVFQDQAGAFTDDWLYSIRVVGPDRVRFLNGMLSNDVDKLRSGQSLWAVKATHKGRTQGLLRVRAEDDALILDIGAPAAERVASALSGHLVADDCELMDETPERDVVFVYGRKAAEAIERAFGGDLADLADGRHVRWGDVTVVVDSRFREPGFELHVPAGRAAETLERVVEGGAVAIDRAAFETLRIESGVAADGSELDEEVIPLEAQLGYAIDLGKGCYVGQEVITRVSTKGGVKHLLVRLDFPVEATAAPSPGAELWLPGGERPVGEVTSTAWSERRGLALGLGFVRRPHDEAGTELRVGSADGPSAIVR